MKWAVLELGVDEVTLHKARFASEAEAIASAEEQARGEPGITFRPVCFDKDYTADDPPIKVTEAE